MPVKTLQEAQTIYVGYGHPSTLAIPADQMAYIEFLRSW